MKIYEFNRNEFKWAEEFYILIKSKLNLPNDFGENADALWDMLTGFIETPCTFIFTGFDRKENQYNQIIIDRILKCFHDAAAKFPSQFLIIMNNKD